MSQWHSFSPVFYYFVQGTLFFMASEVLTTCVAHDVRHDRESATWLLRLCTVLRHTLQVVKSTERMEVLEKPYSLYRRFLGADTEEESALRKRNFLNRRSAMCSRFSLTNSADTLGNTTATRIWMDRWTPALDIRKRPDSNARSGSCLIRLARGRCCQCSTVHTAGW